MPRVPRDARWSCCSSGFCCTLYVLGPVEPDIIEGLRARKIEQHWPPAAEAPWFETRPGPNGPAAFLSKRNGACVFLQEDRRCAVHARFGAEAKPGFCREFPFQVVHDPSGPVVIARPDCAGFHQSSVDGELVKQQCQAVLNLPRAYPVKKWAPSSVEITPALSMPLADWMALEPSLLDALFAMTDEPATLVAHLRSTIEARLGQGPSTAEPARAVRAARSVTYALVMVMNDVVKAGGAPDPSEAAFAQETLDVLKQALDTLERPLSPLTADARTHLNLLLRSQLLGKQFAPHGSVAAGVGLFLLNTWISTAVATPGADGQVNAAALASVLARLVRFTLNQSIHHILTRARPALVDLYLHAG